MSVSLVVVEHPPISPVPGSVVDGRLVWRRARASLIWSLPVLWLFMGPPVFREEARSAASSLEGSFDAWNVFRVLWWGSFGVAALLELRREGAKAIAFIRSLKSLPWWVMLWLASLFLSAIGSPSRLFTIANAIPMLVLVIAATDLGLKLKLGRVSYGQVLRLINGVSLGLMLLVLLTFLVQPWMVSSRNAFGPRIIGGQVAEFAPLGLVVLFVSLSLAVASKRLERAGYVATAVLGLIGIMYSQTRTAYILTALGLAYFALQWFVRLDVRRRQVMIGFVFLLVALGCGVILIVQLSGNWQILRAVGEYLQRDPETIQSMSGRDGISALIIREVAEHPLGFGYGSGPRTILLSSEDFLASYGVVASRIGNAHNMYLEILGGSGILGGITWTGILFWTLRRLVAARGSLVIPVRTLYFVVLGLGITGSSGALPFTQVSVLLWVLIALATQGTVHEHRVGSQPLPTTRR